MSSTSTKKQVLRSDRKNARRKGGSYKSTAKLRSSTFPMSAPTKFGSANPFPSRLSMEFSSELFGSINAGVASGTYGIGLNTLYKPWNSTTPLPNPITFATATLNPAGLTSILSNTAAYRTYVVSQSRISVTFRPGSFADEIMFGVAPVQVGSPYGSMAELSQGPYSRSRPQSSQDGFMTLDHRADVSHFYGVTKEAVNFEDNYSALYNGSPVNALEWQLTFATFTGTNLAGKLYYRVNIYWTVHLETQSEVGLPDTLSLNRYTSDQHKCTTDSKTVTTDASTQGGRYVWVSEDWLGRKGTSLESTRESSKRDDSKDSKSASGQNQS